MQVQADVHSYPLESQAAGGEEDLEEEEGDDDEEDDDEDYQEDPEYDQFIEEGVKSGKIKMKVN